MAERKSKEAPALRLEQRPLTEMQAERLAALSDLSVKELAGTSIAQISEKFRWHIDPELLFFRRICGRVVKRDPVTGIEYPVPGATVHVEDTDCTFLWYYPRNWPWGWFFPLRCRREEIATVVTDSCGNFCVLVPRWEIDWILRWRHRRICFPWILVKPTIRDLIEELQPIPIDWPHIKRPIPIPEPDPPPYLLKDAGLTLRRAEDLVGREVAGRLAALEEMSTAGMNTRQQQALLDSPAFSRLTPPPLPAEMQKIEGEEPIKGVAEATGLEASLLEGLDLNQYIGPFRRCFDIIIPEWSIQIDVPDITFRVTQDVNGDGTEETIYSEGYFDVRWNSGPIPDVTLEASQIAVAGVSCVPDVACEQPDIVMAGFMPLKNLPGPADPYHDAVTGYARRPNRPHPSGSYTDPLPNPLSRAPFCDDLHLRGCNQRRGAQFYRLRYSYNGGPKVPFVGLTWQQFRWVGTPGVLQVLNVSPDSDGWYDILNPADGWMDPHLLLNFRTGLYQDGLYTIDMQLANGAKTPVFTTGETGIRVDNSTPTANYTITYRTGGVGPWRSLPAVCPVVERPIGQSVQFKIDFTASATHLRSISLTAGGCGGDMPELTSAVPANWEVLTSGGTDYGMRHWHTDPNTDNNASMIAYFELPPSGPQGVYGFDLSVYGRAFNPAGWDSGDESFWNYDPVYRWIHKPFQLAVVNV